MNRILVSALTERLEGVPFISFHDLYLLLRQFKLLINQIYLSRLLSTYVYAKNCVVLIQLLQKYVLYFKRAILLLNNSQKRNTC